MSMSHTSLKAPGRLLCLLLLLTCAANSLGQGGGKQAARGAGQAAGAESRAGLVALVRQAAHPLKGGPADYDPLLEMIGDARVVRHGEANYRLLYHQNFSTWNLRDKHMAETIQGLAAYLEAVAGRRAKVVVWAHNSRQGDARMTERGEGGDRMGPRW